MSKQIVWDDDKRKKVVDEYIERIGEYSPEEQPNVTTEIVSDIAQEMGTTTNSVRSVIMKYTDDNGESVYVSKAAASKTASKSTSTGGAGKRRSKADSHADLISAISSICGEDFVDREIVEKLTGKAADYITSVLTDAQEKLA